MSEESAILAQFSDWRTVKGRKVLQLIFEVPLEEQAKVLTHLGAPMPLADLWCGIARVARKGAAVKTAEAGGGKDGDAPPAHKPKRRWQDMPASQRAALLVNDPEFALFVQANGGADPDAWLKEFCMISSKAALDVDPGERRFVRDQLALIESNFSTFRQARGHGVI